MAFLNHPSPAGSGLGGHESRADGSEDGSRSRNRGCQAHPFARCFSRPGSGLQDSVPGRLKFPPDAPISLGCPVVFLRFWRIYALCD